MIALSPFSTKNPISTGAERKMKKEITIQKAAETSAALRTPWRIRSALPAP
jgi:dTDP-4-dehydrorhamnose reductase